MATPTKFSRNTAAKGEAGAKTPASPKRSNNVKANEPVTPPTATGTLGDDNATSNPAPTTDALDTARRDPNFDPRAALDKALDEARAGRESSHDDYRMHEIESDIPFENTVEKVVILVTIKRGLEVIPAEVLEHEIPILKALHLPENVVVVDRQYGVLDIPDSASLELRRLRKKYGAKGGEIIDRLFRDESDVAHKAGVLNDYDFAQGIEPKESLQVDNRRKPGQPRSRGR